MTKKAKQEVKEIVPSILDNFVFMEKALNILDVGLKMEKNVVLYGPGGHGKSDLTMEFFHSKGIVPYVITMGTGMTTDRMFGGMDISNFDKGGSGKLEYLVENSFMNHEFVIFEEMMDAPDFILEQLKDILSSGVFRNGTQIFPIKTQYIVCCTNKTREEFSKNDSLKALMERFPLELNVVWSSYTEITYNKLLESRFGSGQVDPIIPFLLEEYAKANIIISPRIALDAYEIYEECGPDALMFIADFAKKPALISQALKKYKASLEFKGMGHEVEELLAKLEANTGRNNDKKQEFLQIYEALDAKYKTLKTYSVTDEMAQVHAAMLKKVGEIRTTYQPRYKGYSSHLMMRDNIEKRTDAKLGDKTQDEQIESLQSGVTAELDM